MTLSGVNITFGYCQDGQVYKSGAPLPCSAQSSQTMASPTTSAIVAPNSIGIGFLPILSISASAPIFYATGTAPDATGNGRYPRRYLDPSSGREDIFVNPGDKFAWTWA